MFIVNLMTFLLRTQDIIKNAMIKTNLETMRKY